MLDSAYSEKNRLANTALRSLLGQHLHSISNLGELIPAHKHEAFDMWLYRLKTVSEQPQLCLISADRSGYLDRALAQSRQTKEGI